MKVHDIARRAASRRRRSAVLAAALGVSTITLTASTSTTVSAAPAAVIDDFNDGDASDWGFFGGNLAGGGGGAEADRPAEGSHYLSTGWGGQGTDSGFYGGAFRNFDNGAQVPVPADPWFNVWVLNQSNATVDQYNLEITLREDTNGDGWTDGAEDSIGYDTTITSASFDDRWTLVSAPLSAFFDRGTGGNGVFDGALDEVVLVFGGVQGPNPSVIEVDVDQLSFTAGGPLFEPTVVFDDMEHGDPFNNGWFAFNGAVGGGGLGPNSDDLPPVDGGAFSIETGWGSGGTPGFYGGFGRGSVTDLLGQQYFNFWINPNDGQEYTLEINLQEDDDGNGTGEPANDDEFQFNCVVDAAGTCATAGGGWQLVTIPFGDFFDDNSFFTGGNGVLDPVSPAEGGNGELVAIAIAVIGTGSDVNFRTDQWFFSTEVPTPDVSVVIDDFETGLPFGSTGDGELLGFYSFQGDGSIVLSNPATPPAPVRDGAGDPNSVLQMDIDVASFAGYIHAFENAAVDTWLTQDWSTSEGISFWLHGSGSGTQMFIDILDNRNDGSTTDDAERFTVPFVDDVAGWRLLEFPFSSFVRKEIGNGAPNDGLGLFEMHGYAIGTLGTGGPQTFSIDDVGLYGIAEPPGLAVNFGQQVTLIEEGTTGDVIVKLNRPMGPDDPAEVSIDYATERSYAVAGEEYTPISGTLTFTNGGPTELSFPIETFDDTKFEGDEQIVIRLTNPVNAERGALFQGSVLIDDDDDFDPDLLDDFEQGAFLWEANGVASIESTPSTSGAADARPGQDAVEQIGSVSVARSVDIQIDGTTCKGGNGVIPVFVLSTPTFDATTVDPDSIVFGGASDSMRPRRGAAQRVEDVNGDGLDDLVLHVRARDLTVPCDADLIPFNGATYDGQPVTAGGSDGAVVRDFPIGQDWSGTESLTFWYRGDGGGEDITVTLKDNRAPDPGPGAWQLAWSDEFNEAAGTPPNPANWSYEIGDTTPDAKNGWGNEELQYYTDDPDNAATDGDGNLVITLEAADGSQECYYGPCEFESARLVTQNKAEFAYGRIESRLKVPTGGDGLWPAFWSLGTDITYNPWPGAGEIDIMEYVSRIPNEIFGTIHGPGYSGGASFNGIYDFGERVDQEFHTFAVEWEPNLITWYVDGIQYHQAEPSDVPGPWVFEKPFFLLLNFAIGGNFGGAIDPANTYPQEYLVDYVRVYQGPDTAERFEATFTDAVDGWSEVSIPIGEFGRSDDQPAGAPDDGLTLTDVWGYGLAFPNGTASGDAAIDLVRQVPVPPPTELVVSSAADDGAGSLREALTLIADGGTITFDPALAGSTIALSSGQLVADRSVTIDGSGAPGLTISGSNAVRVLQIEAGATVAVNDVTIADGVGAPQGGGVLNFGTLSLDRVVVRDNVQTAPAPANFEFGGGGIYSGAGASLTMTDSSVIDNQSLAQPGGGIYGFFDSTITLIRSTVSGNVSGDVAGGLRTLGDVSITDSTISGNTSTAWHGGGLFATDGSVSILHSTFVGNNSPAGTAGALMVATFGAPVNVTITNSLIADNGTYNCQLEGGAAAVLTSLGGNVGTDASCAAVTTDTIVAPGGAGVGPLADNGGPTATHALLAGSPAIDAGDPAACTATDQRGIARGVACDSGAFELVP